MGGGGGGARAETVVEHSHRSQMKQKGAGGSHRRRQQRAGEPERGLSDACPTRRSVRNGARCLLRLRRRRRRAGWSVSYDPTARLIHTFSTPRAKQRPTKRPLSHPRRGRRPFVCQGAKVKASRQPCFDFSGAERDPLFYAAGRRDGRQGERKEAFWNEGSSVRT